MSGPSVPFLDLSLTPTLSVFYEGLAYSVLLCFRPPWRTFRLSPRTRSFAMLIFCALFLPVLRLTDLGMEKTFVSVCSVRAPTSGVLIFFLFLAYFVPFCFDDRLPVQNRFDQLAPPRIITELIFLCLVGQRCSTMFFLPPP